MSGVILTKMDLSFCMMADVRLVMTLWLAPPRGRHIFSTDRAPPGGNLPVSRTFCLISFLPSVQATGVMSSRRKNAGRGLPDGGGTEATPGPGPAGLALPGEVVAQGVGLPEAAWRGREAEAPGTGRAPISACCSLQVWCA